MPSTWKVPAIGTRSETLASMVYSVIQHSPRIFREPVVEPAGPYSNEDVAVAVRRPFITVATPVLAVASEWPPIWKVTLARPGRLLVPASPNAVTSDRARAPGRPVT